MYATPHPDTSPARDFKTNMIAPGYSNALSARVAELRSRLRGETAGLLNTSSQSRRLYLEHLMQQLHEQLASEQKERQAQAQARAAALSAECEYRRAGVKHMLTQDAEMRRSRARAEQSMRRACALGRAARRAAISESVQQMMAEAQEQADWVRTQFAESARQDHRDRGAFMESMREQVKAMADAFHASHLSRCMEGAERRRGVRAMILDFVSSLKGRMPAEQAADRTDAQSPPEAASH